MHGELEVIDHLGELLQKSIGLADLLQAAGEHDAEVTSRTLNSTAWALRDMLTEARGIVLGQAGTEGNRSTTAAGEV